MKLIKRYVELIGNDKKYSIAGLIFGCTGSYYSVYANEHMGKIMLGDFSKERLILLLYANVLAMVACSFRGACFTYSGNCMNIRLRKIIYNKLINQKSRFYETTPVNKLLDYINNDVRIVSTSISLNINVITRSLVHVIATLWMLNKISWKLTILVCLLIPINMGISKLYEKTNKIIMKGYEELNKTTGTYIHETISHISIIKTYSTEDITNDKHTLFSNKQLNYIFKETILYGMNLLLISNIPTFTTIGIILAAKYLNSTEGLISFILHNQSLYDNVMAIIQYNNEFIKCKEPYKRISELLDTNMHPRGYYIPLDDNLDGKIEFRNIKFKYEKAENNLIENLNFKINAGDKIAIIGNSGSGKSTLVKCLLDILSINSGNIYIDNIDSNTYDNKWLKQKIGYVAQDSILFSDTIANNIAYGIENPSEKDIINAAKKANAHEFISMLPNKYNTVLEGTELSSLSGGQKQRISIARALIRNPNILIFDEATSALDPECEEMVQNTIKKCSNEKNITVIIIAHRFSALEIADKIYRFENSQLTDVTEEIKNKRYSLDRK
jgi:ABC-type multidrug transport system fused ATPase/permease subunit